jgi:hypothetical protein
MVPLCVQFAPELMLRVLLPLTFRDPAEVTVPATFNAWAPAELLKVMLFPAATAIVDPAWKLTVEVPLMV